jgi:hypothetical protein
MGGVYIWMGSDEGWIGLGVWVRILLWRSTAYISKHRNTSDLGMRATQSACFNVHVSAGWFLFRGALHCGHAEFSRIIPSNDARSDDLGLG